MANKHLAIYLNDHLAGATGALELMSDLAEAHAGTPLGDQLMQLHDEIQSERQELERLIDRLGISVSSPRRMGAWLGEKLAYLKLQLDDKSTGAMRLFEGLEALSLGILGKRALWRMLAVTSKTEVDLHGLDYDQLMQRSEDQHRRVEEMRLAAGKQAFESAFDANSSS